MNCHLHPDRPATAYCRTCGRPLCGEDQREIYGVVYCQDCLARPLGVPAPGAAAAAPTPAGAYAPNPYTAPAAAAAAPAPQAGHLPSPGLALLLGFIPGVGAVYNGQYLKAFVQVVVFAFFIAMENTNPSDAVATMFGFGIAGWYFYMLIDSYRTAKQMEAGVPVHDLFGPAGAPGQPGDVVNAPVAAIILIAIGGIFLLRSLGFFDMDLSRYFWPAILIAVGVYLLLRQKGTKAV